MKGETKMQFLQTILDGTKPSCHPRADDLLGIGGDMAKTLTDLLCDLEVLDHEYRAGGGNDTNRARDAFHRLLAQRVWVTAIVEQYHQIQADLGGEGFALLGQDGSGIPYFPDDRDEGPSDELEGRE
ncbi:hypothetical protein [Pseudotabrizicola alkalilacus]|uniref:Uncharacterized protein n=1 Tax=Pseudotabrizicola alkalilacus TaxID=2305252 RepID=A0A411Z3X2_9RHOB|nr:hypothetical protein [Pseudotabrizicola alkalilacus]RGP37730.1 hypothetical protein D1012_07395 [Pseudotabrizicola alkalilacus]